MKKTLRDYTVTIKQEELFKVFEQVQCVDNITKAYKDEGNETEYLKYLYHFSGIYCTILQLGLDKEYDAWKAEQKAKKELSND